MLSMTTTENDKTFPIVTGVFTDSATQGSAAAQFCSLIWPKCQQKNWLSSMHAWAGWQNHFHWCCQLIQARVRTKALRTWQGIFRGAAAKAWELTRGFWLVAESTASSLESKPQQQKWISCSFCNWQITKLYNTDCNQLPILSRHQP